MARGLAIYGMEEVVAQGNGGVGEGTDSSAAAVESALVTAGKKGRRG